MFKKIVYLSFIFLFACASVPEEQTTRTPDLTLTDVSHNPLPSVTQTLVAPTNTFTPSPTQSISKTPSPSRVPTTTPVPEPTSTPQKSNDNIFGVTVYINEPTEVITKMVAIGTNWTRQDVIWAMIETEPGIRNWDLNFEQDLKNVVKAGLQLILILGETPPWALKSGFNCGAVAEDKFSVLGDFAFDLVKRYSAPPYNVKYWEMWNEPDVKGFLGDWGDPTDTQYYGGYYYGKMLKVVYSRIKAADPQAQVLVGGLLLDCDPNDPPSGRTCTEAKFLKGILESGAGPYFDGVSFHAYDFYTGKGTYYNPNWHSAWNTTGPVSIAKANYLKGLLASYGYNQKYLVHTETAVFKGPNVLNPPCQETDPVVLANIEVTKVYYVVQSYTVALAQGWKANVWYTGLGVRCSGLLKPDLSPYPAYYAYQFTRQKLGSAVFVRKLSGYPQVMGYEFRVRNRRIWVVWSLDGNAHTIDLPSLPVLVNRVGDDGQPIQETSALTLTINLSPRFIEFEP